MPPSGYFPQEKATINDIGKDTFIVEPLSMVLSAGVNGARGARSSFQRL
jgi:hypothetical protein